MTSTDQAIQNVFRHYDPTSGVGVIDYIAPYRLFPLQQVKSLDLAAISLDQQRKERIELLKPTADYQKFRSVKQFIVSEQLEDLSHIQATGIQRDSLHLLRSIFGGLFSPKVLLGYRRHDNEMQVAVKTPNGDHDIDELSSGERELLFVLVNLFRIRDLPSVVLYDEPERHLNAGLEAKLLPALDRLRSRNQIWIATHGLELIGSVPLSEVVALKNGPDGPVCERFQEGSRAQRVHLFEGLGAKVGLQLASNRIVFLEGKAALADKRALDRLIGTRLPGVTFVAGGSAASVMSAGTHAARLLEEASKDASFLMVLDRDFRDDESAQQLQAKLNNRAFIWGFHELENAFLIPDVLLRVLRWFDVGAVDADSIEESLRDAARRLEEVFMCQRAAYRLEFDGGLTAGSMPASPRDENSFRAWVDGRRRRASETYSRENVDHLLAECRAQVREAYEDGQWRTTLPGKEILEEFRKRHLPRLPGELFRVQIVSHMVDTGTLAPEVQRLCDYILQR